MGKLDRLKMKRAAAKKKAKADADAAAAADATAAATAAAAIAAADTAADAASCAAAAAVVPATPSGYGIGTRRSYATAVVDGTAVAVVTTSINAAAVSSPSSAVTRSSTKPKLSAAAVVPAAMADRTGNTSSSAVTRSLKKPKLSAAVIVLAAMADRTGDAKVPPAPDLLTKEHKKKSPKKRGGIAVLVGATDASVVSKSRYPSRGNAGRNTLTAVGASTDPVAEKDANTNVSAKKKAATAKKYDEL